MCLLLLSMVFGSVLGLIKHAIRSMGGFLFEARHQFSWFAKDRRVVGLAHAERVYGLVCGRGCGAAREIYNLRTRSRVFAGGRCVVVIVNSHVRGLGVDEVEIIVAKGVGTGQAGHGVE